MSDKLNINNEMSALDRKQRDFYDSLSEEERKKFSGYLMLKWGSAVSGGYDLESYYLLAFNERVNPNYFELSRHPKLQWLLCTSGSPGVGTQRHYFPRTGGKGSGNVRVQVLQKLYPLLKTDEIQLLAEINDTRDIENLARQHGWTDQELRVFKK